MYHVGFDFSTEKYYGAISTKSKSLDYQKENYFIRDFCLRHHFAFNSSRYLHTSIGSNKNSNWMGILLQTQGCRKHCHLGRDAHGIYIKCIYCAQNLQEKFFWPHKIKLARKHNKKTNKENWTIGSNDYIIFSNNLRITHNPLVVWYTKWSIIWRGYVHWSYIQFYHVHLDENQFPFKDETNMLLLLLLYKEWIFLTPHWLKKDSKTINKQCCSWCRRIEWRHQIIVASMVGSVGINEKQQMIILCFHSSALMGNSRIVKQPRYNQCYNQSNTQQIHWFHSPPMVLKNVSRRLLIGGKKVTWLFSAYLV